ncbi:PQQ-like beta-propeller repeat protein [Pyxidicoccus xibeiensis]|uniref:PQQ-like beta-propeller repeat protein n=1 Tax=Pyxidicoccus xibeiensis TaxID=2906759 RepID=UPI0020A75193|nr:PQQ-like beta-propeller repeat protein [Pyxidicoccus xibeiensis]MCP3138894.1 PQQ-like beta-propeller repeat protein [Pyxidicoccus xibeiensis]
MRQLWAVVLGVGLWGCAVEDGGEALATDAEAPAVTAPELPAEDAPSSDEPVQPQPSLEEPGPLGTCSGPDGTARLAWSYEAAWDVTMDFRGTMDADGHTYWTECESAYWSDEDPGQLDCQLVSATRDGAIRYRIAQPPPGQRATHAVDAERVYLTAGYATLSAHARADGRQLWSVPLGELRTGDALERYSLRVDSVVLSPPYVLAVVRHTLADADGKNLLVAVHADTGAVAWKALTPALQSPLVVDAAGNVYGGSVDEALPETTLFSYSADGALRWSTRRAGVLRPTAVDGGTLLLNRSELLDASRGTPLATLATATPSPPPYALGRSTSLFGRAAFQEGRVLVLPDLPCEGKGCPTQRHPGDTFLYGLDPVDGSVRWHRAVGAWPMSPLLTRRDSLLLVDRPVDAECELYGCTGDDSHYGSYLRELDLDGRELSACALPGDAPYITPPALHGGRVVLGAWTSWSADNDWTQRLSIRAFDLAVPTEPAASGWVCAGGGNARSGSAEVPPRSARAR